MELFLRAVLLIFSRGSSITLLLFLSLGIAFIRLRPIVAFSLMKLIFFESYFILLCSSGVLIGDCELIEMDPEFLSETNKSALFVELFSFSSS
jgi:hypothetical protein